MLCRYIHMEIFIIKIILFFKGNEKYMNKAGSSLRSILIKHFHGEFLPLNRRSSLMAMKNHKSIQVIQNNLIFLWHFELRKFLNMKIVRWHKSRIENRCCCSSALRLGWLDKKHILITKDLSFFSRKILSWESFPTRSLRKCVKSVVIHFQNRKSCHNPSFPTQP